MCPKTSWHGRPGWLNRDLWLELKEKKNKKKNRVYDLWKRGQATQKYYKDVVRMCRDCVRMCKED